MNQKNETQNLSVSMTSAVESLLGEVQWLSDREGFARCPGADSHSHRTGRRDCKVYLHPVPTITCFHASCQEEVKAKNTELRRAISGPLDLHAGGRRKQISEDKARLAALQRKESIRRRAMNARDQILRDFRWPIAEITRQSPLPIPDCQHEHWRLQLGLFQPEDVVWIGDIYDSGKPQHAANFRRRDEWLSRSQPPGAFTCPAVFKDGSVARSNDTIVARRFLVVESDVLKKDEVGGVFRWMRDAARMQLRAIVDTAGKSLHGWFDFPPPDQLEDLQLVLPQLGCDPKLFTASQPVRLPGAMRNGRYQHLVWLNDGGAR